MCFVTFNNKSLYWAFANTVRKNKDYKADWVLWDEYCLALVNFG